MSDGVILAVGGTLSAALGTCGFLRTASAVMLLANLIVIIRGIAARRRKQP